ncbi:hypothetical protein BSR29_06295 [Boudabousia liubingyangii]|uniref:cysteine desulfurase n=1 Tax=Boudabousia liubingyangii TaxID=1921764 RepID=A0A1Q5PKR6_9ACTO|nr:cysteine desulfurase family protein [Boudabousia liubingyangii]OKL47224.1 hypothetical protein BSR29_06295 [Boudabousia liubingyangii]
MPVSSQESGAYLDNAASRPVDPRVLAHLLEVSEALSRQGGNPSALHFGGRFAREQLEAARHQVGELLGAQAPEVIFTSGATESDSLAVGGALARFAELAADDSEASKPLMITSELEHPAVRKWADRAQELGFEVLWVPVTSDGQVSVSDLAQMLSELAAEPQRLVLASFLLVDNDTGVIQPVAELAALVRQAFPTALIHCDAAQAVGQIPVSFSELGVDALSLSGHKFGAPAGIGALVVRREYPLRSDRIGGGQERDLRSGTQAVAMAQALAKALELAVAEMGERQEYLESLKAETIAGLDSRVHVSSQAATSPHILHLLTPVTNPEVSLLVMDQNRVAVSAGSACSAGVARPVASLLAMGCDEDQAMGGLRVSFGPQNTSADVQAFLQALPKALDAALAFSARKERKTK